jgi:hypothetical protein
MNPLDVSFLNWADIGPFDQCRTRSTSYSGAHCARLKAGRGQKLRQYRTSCRRRLNHIFRRLMANVPNRSELAHRQYSHLAPRMKNRAPKMTRG